jgi:hypothetical protein
MTFACARRPISDISDAGCQSCQTKTPLSGTKGTENHSNLGPLRPIAVHFGRATVIQRPKRQVSAGEAPVSDKSPCACEVQIYFAALLSCKEQLSLPQCMCAPRPLSRFVKQNPLAVGSRRRRGFYAPLPWQLEPVYGVQQNTPAGRGRPAKPWV